jgi:hypothetical protein
MPNASRPANKYIRAKVESSSSKDTLAGPVAGGLLAFAGGLRSRWQLNASVAQGAVDDLFYLLGGNVAARALCSVDLLSGFGRSRF